MRKKKKPAKKRPAKKRPAKKKSAAAKKKSRSPKRLPKKGSRGVAKREWGPIRRMLLEKRAATLNAMRKIQSVEMTTDVGDEADQAGLSVEKELQFELSDNERNQLDQIEGALRKMDKGTYGLCERCRNPIHKKRIDALPFARYCIQCQNTAEQASLH